MCRMARRVQRSPAGRRRAIHHPVLSKRAIVTGLQQASPGRAGQAGLAHAPRHVATFRTTGCARCAEPRAATSSARLASGGLI